MFSRPMNVIAVLKRAIARALSLVGVFMLVVVACIIYARYIEPTWLCVRHVRLSQVPTVRVIHITDIHFKGDTQYLEKVVRIINGTDADLVCFTGDLIEDAVFLKEALRILSKVNKPMYGIPGNHDEWVIRSFDDYRAVFQATGGQWLDKISVPIPSRKVELVTMACMNEPKQPGYKRILLEHYPGAVTQIRNEHFDLILSGHTHGGQVRIPFVSRYVLPCEDTYDRGLFQTSCGPLYVNPGIGTYHTNMRFRCRPEIAVIDL